MSVRELFQWVTVDWKPHFIPIKKIKYLRRHYLGQGIDWDIFRGKKTIFCFDSMMLLLHMVI